MPNLMSVLKSEITRLARKEVKGSVTKVHKPTVQLKHDVAALKRTVTALVKATNIIQGVLEKIVAVQPAEAPEATSKARLTGKGVRSLRRRLKLSQADFGKLVGISSQSVVNMEKKNGPLAVRTVTRAAILAIRGIGAREAKAKLAETTPEAVKKPRRRKVKAAKQSD